MIKQDPVRGTYLGFFTKTTLEQGYNDQLQPFMEKGRRVYYRKEVMPDGSTRMFCHQSVIISTVVGVSGARTFGIGAGSSDLDWKSGGMGSTSAAQRLVTNIQLRDCDVPSVEERRIILMQEPKAVKFEVKTIDSNDATPHQ